MVMKRVLNIVLSVFLFCIMPSCTEDYNLELDETDVRYLCVQTILTDFPSTQVISLTESVHYKGKEIPPAVSGARVSVTDGGSVVEFEEDPDTPGIYKSPEGFACQNGHRYDLRIERNTEEGLCVYESSSTMPAFGFDIEAIDYKYSPSLMDSLWTIGIWGTDSPNEDYYLVNSVVNGNVHPFRGATSVSDYYFNGASVKGYPICMMNQTWERAKEVSPSFKPFETGDVVSLMVYGMDEKFYDYWSAFSSQSSSMTIPIIGTHPANLEGNISGKNVVGYFAVCPVRLVSVLVDDPYRTEFIYGK